MIYAQTITDIEVILVDNNSTDNTVRLAKQFPVKVVTIEEFRPGLSINSGIRAAAGEYIACLSAHCIPKHKRWLENLLRNFDTVDGPIAGVYGRQIPFRYSKANDKRDLLTTFGLDRRVQVKDAFFHNANSMFPRRIWEEIPFDESTTNIEDRIWGKEVIERKYKIIYEPEAEVFHYHGIHHNLSEQRCNQVVRIMEDIHTDMLQEIPSSLKPENANIVAFVPLVGDIKIINNENLLVRVIRQIRECPYVKDVVVVSEKDSVLEFAGQLQAKAVKRGRDLLKQGQSIETTLKYAVEQYERRFNIIDAVIFVNYLYPFRPSGFFCDLVEEFCYTDADSTIAARKDYRVYWIKKGDNYESIGDNFLPRDEKQPLFRGVWGLGGISSSQIIRRGQLLGESINLLNLKDDKYTIRAEGAFWEGVTAYLLGRER